MFRQIRVPTSTTEVCISAFTRSCRRSLPSSSISVSMWERRSRVTGSMVWYSSSMPREKDGRMGCPQWCLLANCKTVQREQRPESERLGLAAHRSQQIVRVHASLNKIQQEGQSAKEESERAGNQGEEPKLPECAQHRIGRITS